MYKYATIWKLNCNPNLLAKTPQSSKATKFEMLRSQHVVRRSMSSGRYTLPPFAGEPFKNYAPNSPERSLLADELKRVRSQVCIELFFH